MEGGNQDFPGISPFFMDTKGDEENFKKYRSAFSVRSDDTELFKRPGGAGAGT